MIFDAKFPKNDGAETPAVYCYCEKNDPQYTRVSETPMTRSEAVRVLRERAMVDPSFRGSFAIGVDDAPIAEVGTLEIREPTTRELIKSATGVNTVVVGFRKGML